MASRQWKKIGSLELHEKIKPEKRVYLKKLLGKLKKTQIRKRGIIQEILQKPILEE